MNVQAAGLVADINWMRTLLLLAGIGVVLVAAGVALGFNFARNTKPIAAQDKLQESSPAVSVSPAADGTASRQRSALIAGCLRLRQVLDDDVTVGILDNALAASGVERFDPTGARFDPARHRAIGTIAAGDANDDGVIAKVRIPGYLDDGRVLQAADVVIYKWGRS